MIINHDKHVGLIQNELTFRINEFDKLLLKQAAKMFVDKQLYLCRFMGFDEARGNIIVSFDHKICFPPRKGEHFQCFVSDFQDETVRNWGGLTYKALRSKVATQFEARSVFIEYGKESSTVGLSGIRLEDVNKYEKNALLFLAPTDPPLKYLSNLLNFLKENSDSNNPLLQLDIDKANWAPKPLIVDKDIVSTFQIDLIQNDIIIIQGPPGTGKTYLMAQLCNALLQADYRIIVTALTNRALIELAEKEYLESALLEGRVFKTALTADELKNKRLKGLIPLKSLSEQRPQMLLSSYYTMSQIATKSMEGEHFDYVIIEEASQAYLSTIALARKLGKKCIIIGDIKQLEPIFHMEFEPEDSNNYHLMVCGLKALSFYFGNAKQYILTESYRLTPNSVNATNSFYDGILKSKSDLSLPLNFSQFPILNNNLQNFGGTSVSLYSMSPGRIPSFESGKFIFEMIQAILKFGPKLEIAVLAFHRDTVRHLQKEIFLNASPSGNILIDTIDRVQGLTTDFCIFVIPGDSLAASVQPNRFNVATSRARFNTLIVADNNILHFASFFSEVESYFDNVKFVE